MPPVDTAQFAIDTTVMVIREELMIFFRGNTTRFTNNRNVRIVDVPNYSQYNLHRDVYRYRFLTVGGTPIMKIAPKEAILYTKVLERSPQFQEMHKQLIKFFKHHLPEVAVQEVDNALI